ncbi:MAG TPA: TonB-dependent receptor [Chitinophagaceae bacterium]|nr:TonB-dependent receptor [Chitinophagaceae bacterium]
MKRKFFVLAAVLFSTQLQAQSDTTLLEEAVVTANKYERKQSETGKVVTVITRQELDKNSGRTLAELLNSVAGVNIIGANNIQGTNLTVSFRGSSAGNVLILVDGIPVNDPSVITNYFDLNFITPGQAERIEILKGGQSTLYGSDAVAGVINIITRRQSQNGVTVNGNFSGGSFNTLSQHIGLNGRTNKTVYGINYSHTSADGFSAANDSAGSGNFDKDGFNQHAVSARLGFPLSKSITADFTGNYNYYKTELDAAAFTDERDFTAINQNRQFTAGLQHRHSKGAVRFNYHYNWLRRAYLDDSSYKSSPYIDYVKSNYIGATHYWELFASWQLTHWEILTGIDHRLNKTDQWYWSTGAFGPYAPPKLKAEMKQLSPYASIIYKYKKWNLELGGRFNKHSEYGNNVTFTFNPSLRLNKVTKLFANVYSAFKTPTLYQLFDDFAGNPALDPEKGIIAEAGVSLTKEKILSARLTGFYRNTTDAIVYTFNPVNFTGRYLNAGRQTNYGAEAEARLQKGPWQLNLNYTYTNGKTTSAFDGTGAPVGKDTSYFNLYRIPRHALNLEAGYRVNKALSVITRMRTVSKREEFIYRATPETLDAYTTFDVYGEYKFDSRIRLYIDLKNITDRKYFDILGYNARRFNITGGVAFQL